MAQSTDALERENQLLRQENSRLAAALGDIQSMLSEPAEVIRAIRHGEVDALVLDEGGEEQIYALQRFDSVYRTVVEECFPYGVWLTKPDGTLLYVSPSFLDLVDTNLDEMKQKGQFHFLPPETRSRVEREWARCLEQRETFHVDYTIRLPDGSEKAVWSQGILASTYDGQLHWVGVNIDVTHQRAVQDELHRQTEKLRLSEERFRLMADAMPQIVWVTRPDGYHEYYNQRWYDYTGCSRTEQSLDDDRERLLHPDDATRARHAWDHALSTGEPFEIEYRIRGRDGNYRWFLGRALPVRDEAGHIVRWFGTSTDIEEIKRAGKALQEVDRRKDEFLATLAHELRNPLAPLCSGLEALKLIGDNPQLVEETHAMMEQQLKQLVRLIDDLLEVSRITQGKLRLEMERIELGSAINTAVEANRPLIDESEHELSVDLPPEPIYVHGDPLRLAQVFSNLLSNAAKYTDRGGRIFVRAELHGGDVVVSVRDTGIGIPPDHLPTLFRMFSQAEAALERSQGGLGIGLALVRGLVEMHGGSIRAESDGPGKGSQFVVRLPTVPGPQPALAEDESLAGTDRTAKRRILVVDDNRDAARGLATVLKALGNEVITAHDGFEAVEMAAMHLPSVVLLDIGMPGMNGYDAARQIRGNSWGRDMVLIALTGWGQDEDRRKAAEAGFDHHLTKPASAEKIQQLIGS